MECCSCICCHAFSNRREQRRLFTIGYNFSIWISFDPETRARLNKSLSFFKTFFQRWYDIIALWGSFRRMLNI